MEQLANDYNEGLNNYYNGICLDVNQDKEESQYNVIIKSLIAGKCSTTESIMTQIALANLTNNDTAKINTYKDKFQRLDGEIEILTNYTDGLDIFMDNFTVYALTHTDHIIKKVNTEDPTKQSSDTGKYNSSIRNFLHNNIPVKDRDCYIGIKAIGCKKDKEGILSKSQKETYNNLILGGINNISNDYSILKYKISTSELKLKQLINIFTTDNILNGLNKSGLYICDYDITTDLKGCIDKELFINYLLKNHNFTFGEGKKHKNIIENDTTVSNTCLSFWLENETGFLRVKLYDKFKQSLESGSVRANVGCHLGSWINNPGNDLRETIKKSLPCGILRLEITYGLEEQNTKTPPSIDQINKDMEYVKQLLKTAPYDTYFYCSIENQYKRLIEVVNENVIIYNVKKQTMLFCRWYNSLTDKINGFWKHKIKKKEFILTLRDYTFNKPFKLLLVEEINEIIESTEIYTKGVNKGKNKPPIKTQKVKLNLKLYVKAGLKVSPYTEITDKGGNEYDRKALKCRRINTPEEMGIVPHNAIKWIIAKRKQFTSIKEHDVFFIPIKHENELNIIGKTTTAKIQRKEESVFLSMEELQTELQTIKTDSMEQFNKFITAQQIKEVKIEFENVFQKSLNIWTNINKFTDFKNGDIFNLHAFKKTSNNENCKFIIFDNDKQIKIYGNSQLNGFLKKCINDNPQDYQYLKGDIYYLFRDCIAQPTATITIKDCEYDNGNKKINLIIHPNPLIFRLEDPIITYTYCNYTDEDLTKQKVVKKTYINVKDLNENDEFYIYSIYQVKDRYIFKMLDKDLKPINDNIYCGNYYINTNEEIKKIYENKTITQPFKIVIGKPKTTPQNNKAVYIYVVINNIEE